MSLENYPSPEETPAPHSASPRPPGRGYFFYIAVFFILIALLCYLLNNTGGSWTQLVPTLPSEATSSTVPH